MYSSDLNFGIENIINLAYIWAGIAHFEHASYASKQRI